MDEFHYYSDSARGVAWQIPLLELPQCTFLLMSATLGDTSGIQRFLLERTGREVGVVDSEERPVPLDYEYRESPIHETVEYLLEQHKAPIYIVNFTHRECAEQAQALTSAKICTREERGRIQKALGSFRFDSPYGKEMARYLRLGIAVHHAGLLPRYRRLVEQLSEQGLLKVICGTDTLGVGVNIPIRTVLFTKLCKFDGEKVALLRTREFKQIAGRAGRKGFDDQGSVVCQAPEHVIEKRRLARRAAESGAKKSKVTKKPPKRGYVPWNLPTFERLIENRPETLVSRFRVTHGMMVNILQREAGGDGAGGGYRALIDLIERSHEGQRAKARLRRETAALFRSLRRAGIVELKRDPGSRRRWIRVSEDLQSDFSLHHTLSVYLIEAISVLDMESPDYAMEVLSLVEAILEDPTLILLQQAERLKRELLAQLKAEGVPYEERIRQLEEVTHPKPLADFIYETFDVFADKHPWVGAAHIRPKSIVREIFEGYYSFDAYVRHYQLARSEGLLLRYVNQAYTTLAQTVPEVARTQEIYDVLAFLRAMLARVDSSLLEEWERLLQPEISPEAPGEVETRPDFDLARHPQGLTARVRAELHRLVRALSERDFEEASLCVRQDPNDFWGPPRFAQALEPFFAEYEELLFTPRARQARNTVLKSTGARSWEVQQVLVDPADDNLWCLHGEIDLHGETCPAGPLVRLYRIGT
jgi:superfamily II RNA helicase